MNAKTRFSTVFFSILVTLVSATAWAQFGPDQNVSHTVGQSAAPTVSLDGVNTQYVVWVDSTNDSGNMDVNFRLRFVAFPPGGSAPGTSSVIPGTISIDEDMLPRSVVDASGRIHVLYQTRILNRYDIFIVTSADGGATWTTPVNVSQNSGDSITAAVDIDSKGALHLVWTDDTDIPGVAEVLYRRRDQFGTWGSTVNVSNRDGSVSSFPDVAIDESDRLHVVWIDTTSGVKSVFYARQTGPTSFTFPRNISGELFTGPLGDTGPTLVAGPGSRLHLAWSGIGDFGGADIFYQTAAPPAFSFRFGTNISSNVGASTQPRIGADSANQAHVVWSDNTISPQFDIMYAKVIQGASGPVVATGPVLVESTPGRSLLPDLDVDVADALHVCWQDDIGNAPAINFEILCADAPESIPPQTICTITPAPDPNCAGYVTSSPATVTLTSTDNSGSVAMLNYRVNNAAPQTVDYGTCPTTGPFSHSFGVSGEGSRTITYSATDCEGNVEPVGACAVKIDTVPPSSFAVLEGSCNDGCSIYTEAVKVTITASDPAPASFVKTIEYSVDGGPTQTYSGPFTVSGDGQHVVHFRAIDRACNVEPLQEIRFEIRAPLIVEIIRPKDGVWYYNDSPINEEAPIVLPQDGKVNVGGNEVRVRNSPIVTGKNITVVARVTSSDGSPIDWATLHVDGVLRGQDGTDRPSGSTYSFTFDEQFPSFKTSTVFKVTAQDKPPAPTTPRKGSATKAYLPVLD